MISKIKKIFFFAFLFFLLRFVYASTSPTNETTNNLCTSYITQEIYKTIKEGFRELALFLILIIAFIAQFFYKDPLLAMFTLVYSLFMILYLQYQGYELIQYGIFVLLIFQVAFLIHIWMSKVISEYKKIKA
ncbi:MAG: hypothetical protein QXQ19_00465 [Candidatus Aenigmatarchaeota archaeon]